MRLRVLGGHFIQRYKHWQILLQAVVVAILIMLHFIGYWPRVRPALVARYVFLISIYFLHMWTLSCVCIFVSHLFSNYTLSPLHDYLFLQYNVNTVPTFLFINAKGDIIDRIDGGDDVAAVARGYSQLIGGGGSAVTTLLSASAVVQHHGKQMQQQMTPTSDTTTTITLNERLENLIKKQRIMIFMKGVPSAPRCGFSKKICAILDSYNAPYGAFDVLTDEEVRQGLKEYSDWPTYPQLYVDGELVGGLDIVQEMVDDGELEKLLKG